MNTTFRRFERQAKFFTETRGTIRDEAHMTTEIKKSHMPKDSILFEKIIPVALIVLGVITIWLMVFAAGVLLGFVRF